MPCEAVIRRSLKVALCVTLRHVTFSVFTLRLPSFSCRVTLGLTLAAVSLLSIANYWRRWGRWRWLWRQFIIFRPCHPAPPSITWGETTLATLTWCRLLPCTPRHFSRPICLHRCRHHSNSSNFLHTSLLTIPYYLHWRQHHHLNLLNNNNHTASMFTSRTRPTTRLSILSTTIISINSSTTSSSSLTSRLIIPWPCLWPTTSTTTTTCRPPPATPTWTSRSTATRRTPVSCRCRIPWAWCRMQHLTQGALTL